MMMMEKMNPIDKANSIDLFLLSLSSSPLLPLPLPLPLHSLLLLLIADFRAGKWACPDPPQPSTVTPSP